MAGHTNFSLEFGNDFVLNFADFVAESNDYMNDFFNFTF